MSKDEQNPNKQKKELLSQLNFLCQSPKMTDEDRKIVNDELTKIVKDLQKKVSI